VGKDTTTDKQRTTERFALARQKESTLYVVEALSFAEDDVEDDVEGDWEDEVLEELPSEELFSFGALVASFVSSDGLLVEPFVA
jgi:hypothetical protein